MKSFDRNKLAKTSLILGMIFLSLGYLLNSGFQKTLQNNISGNNSSIIKTFAGKSNYDPNPGSDNPQTVNHLKLNDSGCIYIAPDSVHWQKDTGLLAVLNTNFGYQAVPEFDDLVYLRDYNIESNQFTRLRKTPALALAEMTQAMQKADLEPYINSGFRYLSEQRSALASWTAQVGSQAAQRMAAKPGFSEHHLGTTVDILSQENNLKLLPSYETTKVYSWLKENAYKFGFVMSYPKDATGTTGYAYEPWHYRYVGKEIAGELQESHMILQDYLYHINNYCLTSQ